MAVNDITTNFQWDLPDVGGDVGAWGGILRSIFGEDTVAPLGIDSVLGTVRDTADAALPAAGGTMTGNLTVAPTSGESLLTLNRSGATVNADVRYSNSDDIRAEAGIVNDAGADYRIRMFDDAGAGTTVLTIDRASHEVSVSGDFSVGGAFNVGSFAGDGSGLTNLNASELDTGIIPDGRFPNIMDGPGVYRAADGQGSGSPAYSFQSDSNTGMFSFAENQLAFSAAGSARLLVTTGAAQVMNGAVFTGDGSGLTSLNANNLSTGEVAVARLPLIQAAVARGALNLAGSTTVAISVSVPGATSTSAAFVGIQEIGTTESFSVTSNHCGTGTVSVVYQNQTGALINIPAHTLRIVVFRFQ